MGFVVRLAILTSVISAKRMMNLRLYNLKGRIVGRRLNSRLVKYSELPTPSGYLLKRNEAQVFDSDPIRSDPPLRVFGSDILPLRFLRKINVRLGAAEYGDKPQ